MFNHCGESSLTSTAQPSLATSTSTAYLQVHRNYVEVCQRHCCNISARALRSSIGYLFLSMTMVCVDLLHATAPSSYLYWNVERCRQWTCSVEKSAISLTQKCVTDCVQGGHDFWRPPSAVAAFSRFQCHDTNDYAYLLTYLLGWATRWEANLRMCFSYRQRSSFGLPDPNWSQCREKAG